MELSVLVWQYYFDHRHKTVVKGLEELFKQNLNEAASTYVSCEHE